MNRFSPIIKIAFRSFVIANVAFFAGIMPSQNVMAQDSEEKPVKMSVVDEDDLKQYAGSYGPRNILFKNGELMYQREGMPMAISLEELGDDSFAIIIPEGAQVRGAAAHGPIPIFVFNRNDDGEIVSLSLVDPDGNIMSTSDRS